MNALAKIAAAEPVWSVLDEFRECAEDYARFHRSGWLEKADAVDCAQKHAELWGAVDAYGRDTVQAELAAAFAEYDLIESPPLSYSEQIICQWELSDPRDRWKHTGEAPPLEIQQKPAALVYRTPPSTINAFFYVAGLSDAAYLKRWLEQHPRDAETLCKLWEGRNVAA